MTFAFTPEQIKKFNLWKQQSNTSENRAWIDTSLRASNNFNNLLSGEDFQTRDLKPELIDDLFRFMKQMAANRNLGRQLYEVNGLENFNKRLRTLLFGTEPIVNRMDQFFEMKGIREVTMSHFLCLFKPTEYPFYSSQTFGVLDISKEQYKEVEAQTVKEFNVHQSLDEDTFNYLQHLVVFRELKRVLSCDSYPEINLILWDAYLAEGGIEEGRPNPSVVAAEKELYAPIRKWIEDNFGKRVKSERGTYWIRETANDNRKGRWSRPDITFVEVNRFMMLPQRNCQVTSFEIKRAGEFGLPSVYETTAHQRWTHYSYLVLEVANEETELAEDLVSECARFGIGLMKAFQDVKTKDYVLDEILHPHRQNPEPKEVDKMLIDFFRELDESEEQKFKDAIGKS